MECFEAASASLICVIQYEIEDRVLNLRLAVDMDASDVGVSSFPRVSDLLDRTPDTGVIVPEGVGLGLAPGFVGIECLRGGFADLSFTDERSRAHMLLVTSEDGLALLGTEPLGGASANGAGSTFPRLADRSGYRSLDPFAAAEPDWSPGVAMNSKN